MGANVHDRCRTKTGYIGIIRLGFEDQNVSIGAEIGGIDAKVDWILGLRRNDSEFGRSGAKTERRDRENTAIATQFVIPSQSLPKAH
jgi:hypothetical protein